MLTVSLTIQMRPWTTNSERRGNRYQRATNTKEWRELAFYAARSANPPTITDATAIVDVWLKGRLQDCGACHPSVKALIDGLVDANVLHDDTGEHLTMISFKAPQRAKSDGLAVHLTGWLA